jgi:hypothetical protein
VKNASSGSKKEMEISQAASPGGSFHQRNNRINRIVRKHRAQATVDAQLVKRAFGSKEERKKEERMVRINTMKQRIQKRKRAQKTTDRQIKHARGNGPSEEAANYATKYPGAIYNAQAGSVNCLIRAIAYVVAFNMLCNQECDERFLPHTYNRKTLTQQAKLKDGDRCLTKLINHLLHTWQQHCKSRSSQPQTVDDARTLMNICPLLQRYSLHIAIVSHRPLL